MIHLSLAKASSGTGMVAYLIYVSLHARTRGSSNMPNASVDIVRVRRGAGRQAGRQASVLIIYRAMRPIILITYSHAARLGRVGPGCGKRENNHFDSTNPITYIKFALDLPPIRRDLIPNSQ